MKQFPRPSTDLNLRAQVVSTLLKVQQGQSLSGILHQQLNDIPDRDRALFHELVLGTLRQWFALKAITLPLLTKPLNNETVESCLYLGLYQVLCTRIPAHAAISETVTATKQLGFHALSGIVNAILRRATRETDAFQSQLRKAHGLPSWLYKRLKRDWPAQLDDLCQQLKHTAPLTLRINQRQIGRDAYLLKLQAQSIQARACAWSDVGIVIEQSVQITELPGYQQGWFSVQDEHAQLCASLLHDLDQKTVLDACAAPGGKTAHLLEAFKPEQLIALDHDAKRLLRVSENISRLQLDASRLEILAADATTWQAPDVLDCIVLDAPCSAIGVLRRHPDIRLLRQSTDIAQTVALQQQILKNLWPQLKVGGTLLYITCSILKPENEQQMQAFFAEHANASELKIEADWGIEQAYGRQLLPTSGQGDGFYYCRIKKIA
ncbi:16S rRNA (cytosine(967)-C(5))-methyltransferase RsmB [Acinetobacter soli]|uniref:16S rRNA (cytosine(967)-C(5))-methyltransferase n=1 Tax=Acinetobacter soli NIPH 2899 TaxID=1217677 RepID=A0ABP2U9Z7_9GAMM|nr:16S rRNA (cytosine(967)-C(5))-methyltransferase RsmB [Acinetobacter soli]ENV61631.1 ribosomal RNA small subunit methyltransferase B [Acinetobacter soli NIPH 2899]MBO3638640.1 16S rRNA (cytosine(967)-C(5))-methyltransferase RsmB [Acinetobacter soli]WEH88465.1 16S rRNA (cytosine(967)-C(5))-methyltransferase RsmB [Acinetobacter soli]WEI09636.1 16S rRNA (cytosine(967)-C(5))-methyltransferase RsmB [Acinetobacter soli]WOQ36368.1 16S rRNA (cytosine(967)-C(5))-methyltransferase RsmB [Acinetobacter 